MKRRLLPLIFASGMLFLALAACSLLSSRPADATEQARQIAATTASMQVTLDSQQAAAQATTQALIDQAQPAAAAGGSSQAEDFPTGSITGRLSYPSEGLPPLRIVAFHLDTSEYHSVEVYNQINYRMDQIPTGRYVLVAYPIDSGPNELSGGYSQAVLCGLTAQCTDHGLIVFEVKADQVTEGINPADWYAPAGAFPPQP